MPLVDRNQKIETLSTNCSNQPLTERIRLGSSDRRLQRAYAKAVQRLIESQRKNAVPVVNDESVWMIEGQEFPELLYRPLGGRMFGHIAMQNSARTDFHRSKHVQDPERRRHKKSQATIPLAWFRTKVDHRWLVPLPRGRFISRYRRTVRGETRMPSLRSNSLAIRSSPQLGLSRSIARISALRFLGSGGRPRRRDFHRHNIRRAVRCHVMNVSGLTITRAHRQSKNRASVIIGKRVAGVVLTLSYYVPGTAPVVFGERGSRR